MERSDTIRLVRQPGGVMSKAREHCRQLLCSAAGLLAAIALPVQAQTATDPAIEARVDALLAKMSLPHKVAQLIQPDISTVTPDDMRAYRFGSFLNGGNSGPAGDDKAPAKAWLALADAYWQASSAPLADGEPAIPALWGTDAVHGHNNIIGATLFPHNVALGAANDPELMRSIGSATAAEIVALAQQIYSGGGARHALGPQLRKPVRRFRARGPAWRTAGRRIARRSRHARISRPAPCDCHDQALLW